MLQRSRPRVGTIGLYSLDSGGIITIMPDTDQLPILVVDDVPLIVDVVRGVLSQLGLRNVDAAGGGGEALLRLRERRYGLVISD